MNSLNYPLLQFLYGRLFWGMFALASFSSVAWGQAFSDETAVTGIALIHDGTGIPGDIQSIGSGAVWFDYNNDGYLDLYVTMRLEGNKLYRNNGDGTFTDVASMLGVADAGHDGSGAAAADFNNDGWQDLFLANGNQDVLFKNNNGTSFTNITASAGISTTDQSRGASASWADYDQDGFLDLYVANHNMVPGYSNGSTQDRLYHNNGNETFTDVSEVLSASGIITGFGFIGGWTDFDRDGDPDLFLVNDCLSTNLISMKIFRNDGDTHPTLSWKFTEVSISVGVDDCANGMGISVGDYNKDGWMDVFYSDIGPANLFQNINGTFSNVTNTAGVGDQVWPDFSWGNCFFDYDLDGWPDLFLVLGSHHYPASEEPKPNMLFHNKGNGINFTDVSAAMNMNDEGRARTAVYGDYDNDGDPDMFIVNYGEPVLLMRNNNSNGNHFLKVHLIGTVSNSDGIGSYLKLTTSDGMSQYFETRSGSSLGGGDAIDAYFGLGSNTQVTSLEITWPSGIIQVIENISADQYITAVESDDPCVNVSISAPEAVNAEACQGEAFPALMAIAEPGLEVNWYNSPTDGSLLAQSSTTYTPTGAGTFYAETQDPSTGCKSATRTAVTLIIHENPTVNGGLNEFACQGTPVTFTAVAAGGDGNYSFAWPNGLSNTAQLTVAPPTHTSYTVTVTDGNGCTGTDVVTAVVYELPTVMASADGTICSGVCTTLGASASGGTSPYSYSWSGGSAQVCPTTTTVYTVTVTDNHGCEDTDEQMINVLPTPVANAGMDGNVCAGDCYTFAPSASGGEMPYTFQWSGVQQTEVCPAETTTYTLTVTGNNGCSATDDLTLTVVDLPQVEAGTDENLCQGACYTFAPTASGGTGSYGYAWSSGTTEVCPTQT
ncbi:MAG: VCBS repeat-containing protein, partial [Saprospiraceae bacterium]|nr:VCBS repeat-containing protein [Saprospiraceae bacterium]